MNQLHIDLRTGRPGNAIALLGGNVGHASLLLRKDVQRHLQTCRDELGFKHVRFAGIWSDDMLTVRPDGAFDFAQVEAALDVLIGNHLIPFLDLSGVPERLAGGAGDPGQDDAGASPPQDWGRWYDLVKGLATMIDGRFGCDAREWYFELGEGTHRTDATGTRQVCFRAYDLAAQAIKEVHPEFRVGGPLTDGGDAFLQHVKAASEDYKLVLPRCDFVTVEADRADGLSGARRAVTDVLGDAVAVICVGRNDSNSDLSLGRDDCNHAAAVCETMAGLSGVAQGSLYDGISDVREHDEAGWHYEPFHGGRGLVTVNDIRKAAFNAFRLLGEHRGFHSQRVGTTWTEPVPGLGCLASVEEYTLRLLFWYHQDPAAAAGPVRFAVEGLDPSIRTAQIEVIRPGAGSAYEAWVAIGRPQFVNREVLDALEAASQPALGEVDFREYPPRLEPGMVMQLTIPLPFEEPYTD